MKKNLLFFCLIFAGTICAQPPLEYTYDEIAADIFWNRLYAGGGWSLNCGLEFNEARLTPDNRPIIIEHIYSTNRIIKALKCSSRSQCYAQNPKFVRMEADLHNLYPVWLETTNALYDSEYGEIEDENWRFDDCDFERKNGNVEPRPLARGNIARAILYMHKRYDLPVSMETLKLLKAWNIDDPPSQQEISRNDLIEKIQGNRNPYIDDPALASKVGQD